jgi:sec-independent protein translocase protein TatA
MGSLSIWHWIVVIVVVLLLFGRGKISELMGDVAQGIKSFKKGMQEDEKEADAKPAEPTKTIEHQPASTASATTVSGDLKARSDTERKFEGSTS